MADGFRDKAAIWLGLKADVPYPEEDEATEEVPGTPRNRQQSAEVDIVPARGEASVTDIESRRPVAASADLSRIVTVHPRTYNEARTIGENFRDGIPVIMNLSDMEDADAKRLVDFSAGLIFGLHGTIERVTSKVFLLSPVDVHVTAEDKERIAGSLFNQS
ncbi:MAG: cell division protein SepF [Propioniciclava sp.]